MVSNRSRANKSVGNKLNNLDTRVARRENRATTNVDQNAVTSTEIADSTIQSSNIAGAGVVDQNIARGSVGTEHLGVVTRIDSDSSFILSLGDAGYFSVTGALYPAPAAGTTTTLALDANQNIVLGANSGSDIVTTITDWNLATKTGFYRGAASLTNAPDTTAFNGWVVAGATTITQWLLSTTTDVNYKRIYTISSSTWSAWTQEPTAANTPVLTGGVVAISQGGTGNTTGLAASATKLATGRTIQTSLASTTASTFDGTAAITPGVTGTLGVANGGTGNTTGVATNVSGTVAIANGGTGATTATTARTNLGAAATSHTHAATDITSGTLSASVMPAGYLPSSAGTVDVAPTTAATTNSSQGSVTLNGGSATVTFPVGRFSVAPIVVATPNSGVVSNFINIAVVSSITTTGCTIGYMRYSTTTTTINYIATQPG